jgi:membrane fusion protein (multidrug efflux system)
MSTAATAPATTAAEPSADARVDAPPKKGAKRSYLILAAVVLAAVLAYALFTLYNRGREGTDDAQVDADVVPVSARVAGAVLHVHVKDNATVKKGDVLVEIDPAELQAKVKETEAQLAAANAQAEAADAQVAIVAATSKGGLSAAKAQLSGSAASVGSADAQIAAAQAAVKRAEAEAQKAKQDLDRAESLRKDEAIPQSHVDTARATNATAQAALAQARAQLAVVQDMKRAAQTRVSESAARVQQSAPVDAQLSAAKASADLAHARAAAAQAALDQTKLQLTYTRIEAPIDGVLSKLAVREGQLVQPGSPIVMVVPSTTYVTANFKETQVGDMKPGQRATIAVDAFPGREFEGKVVSASPGTGARFSLLPPDNASGNFVKVVQRVPIKIEWTNLPSDVRLAAGMSADVTVYTR